MTESAEGKALPPLDTALVERLVAAQFPQWSRLPVRPVDGGWDNRTFRLGDHLAVRLPSAAGYAAQVAKEHRWLPWLAPQLPLPVSIPLARGVPSEGYPFAWSVYRWLEGEDAERGHIGDMGALATTLAGFLTALQQVDAADGPAPGLHSAFRGGPLQVYDAETRRTTETLDAVVDGAAVTAVWEAALDAMSSGPPVWFHGDVTASNLLVRDGALTAVIDFGCSGVGDPACDLTIAWTLFSGASRDTFRDALAADAATWARARGWALWKALITVAEHRLADAQVAAARQVVTDVVTDHER